WILVTFACEPLVWREICLTDPSLMQVLNTPNLTDWIVFSTATRSGIAAGNLFRVTTDEDVNRHANALLPGHRQDEVSRLMVRVNQLSQLVSSLAANHGIDVSKTLPAVQPVTDHVRFSVTG